MTSKRFDRFPGGGKRAERRRQKQLKRQRQQRQALGVLGGITVLLLLVALVAGDESSNDETGGTTSTATAAAAPQPEEATAATAATGPTGQTDTIQDARDLVDDDDYDEALAIAAVLGANAERDIGRRIANRIGQRATAAIRRGNRGGAKRLLASAGRYPTTGSLTAARSQLRAATQRVSARRAAAAEAAPEPTAAGGGDYAGLTCPQIGMPFSVVPGSDPDHDQDNDGEACESQ